MSGRWSNSWGSSSTYDWVEVYNGSAWVRIFNNKFTEDSAWQYREYDVSKFAANNSHFQARFKFEVSSSYADAYSGWNIDDFEVSTLSGTPNVFTDPDFEAESAAWTLSSSGSNLHGYLEDTSGWASHNDGALYLYTHNNSNIAAGAYRGYQQLVELTGIDALTFDAYFENGTHITQQVLIDGSVQWSRATPGTYLNQTLDVSSYTGSHTVAFRLYVSNSGTAVPSEHLSFDNLRVVGAAATGAMPAAPAPAPRPVASDSNAGSEMLWIGLEKDGPNEATAQRFDAPGQPVQVIGNSFDTYGNYYALAASGTTLYSGSGGSVQTWDGMTGAYLGPLTLSRSLSTEIGDGLMSIGTTEAGELLLAPFGFATQQRGVAKYSPTGTYLRTYTHPNLQHVQGTPAGNNDAVFVASRYNPDGTWREDVLMFTEAGQYVGSIATGGDVGDVALMGDQLYVLVFGSGVKVYDLNRAADRESTAPSMSADGRFTAFASAASNLVPGDTNGCSDVFVYDRQSGAIERVSMTAAGGEGNAASRAPTLSADGRYVAFESDAANLAPGDTNGTTDVFVFDRYTGVVGRGSVASDGSQGNSYAVHPSISADGRYTAFESSASNLVPGDTNGASDVFVFDRQNQTVQRVSVAETGTQGNAFSVHPSLSGDGRYVTFESEASNLVPGDTNGARDVFVVDRQTQVTERLSVAADGTQGNSYSVSPSVSADGRYVAFESNASNLVPGDGNGLRDVFVYDRLVQTIQRVSVSDEGAQGNGNGGRPSISADGRFVAFESAASNLVPGDTNGTSDVFVFDRQTHTTQRVSAANGGAEGNGGSQRPSISGDGRFIALESEAANLVSADANGLTDAFLYDRTLGTMDLVSFSETSGGTALPTYSHTIALPAGVTPSSTYTDEIYTHDGYLYVEDDPHNQWHKLDLNGHLIESYNLQTRGTYNTVGSLAIVSAAGDTAPPTITARLPAANSTITTRDWNLDITFSEPVQGVDVTDLVLSGTATAAASVGSPTAQGGNVWRFPVSGLVSGTLNVVLAPDAGDIEDAAGNDLTQSAWGYTVTLPQGQDDWVFVIGTDSSGSSGLYRFQRNGAYDTALASVQDPFATITAHYQQILVTRPFAGEVSRYLPDGSSGGSFRQYLTDSVDADLSDDLSADALGNSTLRAAVMQANASPGADTIFLPEGVFSLTRRGAGEDRAETGDLDITESLTIVGAGLGLSRIDAGWIDRAFHVFPGVTLNLVGVTVTGGWTSPDEDGAGILSSGTLHILDSAVESNFSQRNGGGIHNDAGQVYLERALLVGNTALEDGGGISSAGSGSLVSLRDSQLIRNFAVVGNGGGLAAADGSVWVAGSEFTGGEASQGGGVFNSHAQLTIAASTFAENRARLSGGGLFNDTVAATAAVVNSTFSDNYAGGAGAISNQSGWVQLINTTIMAKATDAAVGGIVNIAGTVELENTVVAGTTDGRPDVAGVFVSAGHNLIGNRGTATGLVHRVNGDLVGDTLAPLDPGLGPLDYHGAATRTHAPLPGSPVIDAGSSSGAPASDQSGRPRPQDGNGDGTLEVDIGAVERFLGGLAGRSYHDLDHDGTWDPGEPLLAGRTVFLDFNGNGNADAGEPYTTTSENQPDTPTVDETGSYFFSDLPPGTYRVVEQLPSGWEQTYPTFSGRAYEIDLLAGQAVEDLDFGSGVTVTVADLSVDSEGHQGTRQTSFNVRLSAALTIPVTVGFATADGSAVADQDYLRGSGIFIFAPGETSKLGTLTVLGDVLDENDETCKIVLTNSVGARIENDTGLVTIVDDDPLPALAIDDVTVDPEGDLGVSQAKFKVTLSVPSGRDVTVDYATLSGTAAAAEDFTVTGGTLRLVPGQTTAESTVPVLADLVGEPSEFFLVRLSRATAAVLQDAEGRGTILDDDPLLTVNSSLDKPDLQPGNFVVDTGTAGEVTLRAAIMEANALAGDDAIKLPAGTYALTREQAGEDLAAQGDLDIIDTSGSLIITGAGAALTIIDAQGLDRVFHVHPGAKLTLVGVTVQGGNAHGATPHGGGLENAGTLVLIDSVVRANHADEAGGGLDNLGDLTLTRTRVAQNTAQSGGAIQNLSGATAVVVDGVLDGNQAAQSGGAIAAAGTVSLSTSILRNNTALLGGAIVNEGVLTVRDSAFQNNTGTQGGGALFNNAEAGNPVLISGSTFADNQTAKHGGALYLGSDGTLTLSNSTLTRNRSGSDGGAIYNQLGTLSLLHVTVAGNSAGEHGGGVANTAFAEAGNTLIAGNTAMLGDPDVSGVFASLGYNLIGAAGTATGFVASDLVGSVAESLAPLLLDLADNGGPTGTMALLPDSPAIDAAGSSLALATDQRGVARPQDGDLNAVAVPDIGAFELTHNLPPEIVDQDFFVVENSPLGMIIGIVQAMGPEPQDTVEFSVLAESVPGVFVLAPDTGRLSLAGSVDFERITNYQLTVQARDQGQRTTTATITVRVQDENEVPYLLGSGFDDWARPDAASTEVVGLAGVFADPDAGDPLVFSAVSSNPALVAVEIRNGNTLAVSYRAYAANQDRTPATITVRATDALGLAVGDSFTVTVAPVVSFEYALVVVAQPTPQFEVTTLPTSLRQIAQDQTLYVEVWVRDLFVPGATGLPVQVASQGVKQAAIDLTFDPERSLAVRLDHAGVLDSSTSHTGAIDQLRGLVSNFGGRALIADEAVTPRFGKLGFLELRTTALGELVFQLQNNDQLNTTLRAAPRPAGGTDYPIHASQLRLSPAARVMVVPEGGTVPFAPAVQFSAGGESHRVCHGGLGSRR